MPNKQIDKEKYFFQMDWWVPERFNYIKQTIATSPILTYLDPDKKYYFFTGNSKQSWCGVLV